MPPWHWYPTPQVSPEQADSIAAVLRSAGNTRVTMRHFPATNHLFLDDPVGDAQRYATLRSMRVRPEVLGALADWLANVFR